MKKTYDKKIFRLWAILNKMDSGKKVYTSILAEEFGVSVRSIQRDIELLNIVGFPVESCGKGCYRFVEGFSLGRVMLSEEDASLLSFLCEIAKSLGGKFEHSFNGMLKKILKCDSDSAFYFKVPEGIKLSKEYPFINQIEESIEENKKLKIEYVSDNEKKKYLTEPLKVMYYDGFWYMLAKIKDKNPLRKFRLDNIESVVPTEEYYDIPNNLKTMLDESVNVWFDEKNKKKVTLKIDKQVATYFKKKKYFPKQIIKKENKDGSIVLESAFSDDMEIIPTVLHWIPWVEVIQPKEIKDQIHEKLKTYLKK